MVGRPAYQTEPIWLHRVAWQQGHLTGLQVLRIAAWKSAKGLASLTLNSDTQFQVATSAAIKHITPLHGRPALSSHPGSYWDEWGEAAASAVGSKRARTGLLALDGVNYRMASAILCVLDPEVWPVIDKWAVETVSLDEKRSSGAWYGWRGYRAFARHLAEHGPTHWPEAKTIHDLDQCAMRASEPKDPACVPARFPKIGPT